MLNEDLIELDDGEYQYLSEKFDIMSEDDVRELPRYIMSCRHSNFQKLVNLAIENELDEMQQNYIREKFFSMLNVSDISRKYDVSRQSVYRVLEKAEKRLFETLKYAYFCGFTLLNPPKNLEEMLNKSKSEGIYENNNN